MATIINALVVTLGLKTENIEQGLRRVQEQTKETFAEMGKAALGFIGVVASVGAAIEGLKSRFESQIQAGLLARDLGADVQQVQALGAAVRDFGGSSQGMESSLRGLNSELQMIAIHGPRSEMALKVFAGLGISEVALKGKDATQVMGMLADAMQKATPAKAMALGERLRLDAGTVRMLQTGRENVEQLTGALRKLMPGQDQINRTEELEKKIHKIRTLLGAIADTVLGQLEPTLDKWSKKLEHALTWLEQHGEVTRGVVTALGVAFAVMGTLAAAAGAKAVISWTLTGAAALKAGVAFAWTAIQATAAWLAALGPIGWIIAGLAAITAGIAYVGHEYEKFRQGLSTPLDGLFKSGFWKKFGGEALTLFVQLKGLVKDFLHMFVDEWDIAAGLVTGDWERVKRGIVNSFKDLGSFFNNIALTIAYEVLVAFFTIEKVVIDVWDKVKAKAKEALGWITDHLQPITNIVLKVATAGMVGMSAQGAPTVAGMTVSPAAMFSRGPASNTTNTRNTTVNIGTVNTQATDAQGFARELPGAIQSQSGLVAQADAGFR